MTDKKLSKLQRGILTVALLSGGRIQTRDARRLIYGETQNEKVEQSRATSLSRAASRLVARGLTQRHFTGLISLTPKGAILAAHLLQHQTNSTGV